MSYEEGSQEEEQEEEEEEEEEDHNWCKIVLSLSLSLSLESSVSLSYDYIYNESILSASQYLLANVHLFGGKTKNCHRWSERNQFLKDNHKLENSCQHSQHCSDMSCLLTHSWCISSKTASQSGCVHRHMCAMQIRTFSFLPHCSC